MAFQQITINSMEDYLTKIKDFAILNGWILVFHGDPSVSQVSARLVIKNSDSSVFVGWDILYSILEGEKVLYNSKITGNVFEDYDQPTLKLSQQLNAYILQSYFSFPDEKTCTLYMHLNNNRVVTSVFSGESWSNFMGGKYSGYGSPVQQPNQFFSIMNDNQPGFTNDVLTSDVYNNVRFNFMGTYNINPSRTNPGIFEMHEVMQNYDDTTYTLFPITLRTGDDVDDYIIGELDDIYIMSSRRLSPGAEFTFNLVNYIVLPWFDGLNNLYAVPKQ